ncbi:hypothetical protein UO65_4494 [Actinokineospora spheciospongiae]|uniref:Uncharacterized protein n=1 Tax=Actinokineospora spheciospongiae TaxID=909613 RepID=W7IH47_9PSEU|nr:hypothetical protein [Actinokineospora spheciospongiae]EWC60210.1 hypothetical protein UO65_4494 [Actinokineospora spheciospongiae]
MGEHMFDCEHTEGVVESTQDPVILDRQDAARALLGYFLANADANDHDANDHLVEEFRRRARDARNLPAPRADQD